MDGERSDPNAISAELRREELAIRTVTQTVRSALRALCDARRPARERRARAFGVIGWARDSIRAHEYAVATLMESAAEHAAGDTLYQRLEADLSEVRDLVSAAERSLDASPATVTG